MSLVHILFEGWTLCGSSWLDLRSEMIVDTPGGELRRRLQEGPSLWIGFQCAHEYLRDEVNCAPCLVAAGQRFPEHGWHAIEFGPHGYRCDFCGKYGDESTMDPLSGDGQGCFDCVGNWLDGLKEQPRTDGIEVVDVDLGEDFE